MRQRAADLEPSPRTPITWERNNLILSSPGTLGGRWVFVIGAYSTLLSTVENFFLKYFSIKNVVCVGWVVVLGSYDR